MLEALLFVHLIRQDPVFEGALLALQQGPITHHCCLEQVAVTTDLGQVTQSSTCIAAFEVTLHYAGTGKPLWCVPIGLPT